MPNVDPPVPSRAQNQAPILLVPRYAISSHAGDVNLCPTNGVYRPFVGPLDNARFFPFTFHACPGVGFSIDAHPARKGVGGDNRNRLGARQAPEDANRAVVGRGGKEGPIGGEGNGPDRRAVAGQRMEGVPVVLRVIRVEVDSVVVRSRSEDLQFQSIYERSVSSGQPVSSVPGCRTKRTKREGIR